MVLKKELLAGTQFNIKATDGLTNKKLINHAKELRSSLDAGSFNAGSVSGTQEPYNLSLICFQWLTLIQRSLTLHY